MPTPAPAQAPRPLRLEYVEPSSLDNHPQNWRKHPELQREALGAVLDEVGWAGALLYNERTGRLVDGHARKDLALAKGVPAVPVLVGNWTPAQEAKILATLDPIGALAETDAVALDAVLRDVQTGNEALATLLTQLAEEAKIIMPPEPAPPEPAPAGTAATGGSGYALRVLCPSDARRAELMSQLRGEGYDCQPL